MYPLNEFTLLRISGADAASFLQGQLTNDVEMPADQWQFSGYCNPKGRLLASLHLWRDADQFYALLDRSIAESVSQRLRMFVLRSKVSIEQLSEAVVVALFDDEQQPDLQEWLASGEGDAPGPDARRFNCHRLIPAERDNPLFVLGFGNRQLLVASQASEQLSSLLSDAEPESGKQRWQDANIRDGIAQISANTQELFIPQMVNLDLLGGINFKKGCYTGQEIVARMHYLGKLKQRMFLCQLETASEDSSSIKAGSKISTSGGQNAGNLASEVIDGRCLAVLRLDKLAEPLVTERGTPLSAGQVQPYPLENG